MHLSSYSYTEQPAAYYSALLCSNQLLPSFPATCRESYTSWWLRRDWSGQECHKPLACRQSLGTAAVSDSVWCRDCVCLRTSSQGIYSKWNLSFIKTFSLSPGVLISKGSSYSGLYLIYIIKLHLLTQRWVSWGIRVVMTQSLVNR